MVGDGKVTVGLLSEAADHHVLDAEDAPVPKEDVLDLGGIRQHVLPRQRIELTAARQIERDDLGNAGIG